MLLKIWLNEWSKSRYINIKKRSVDIYNYYLHGIVSRSFGSLNVEDITMDVLQNFVLHLINEKKYSSNTISECFRILKSVLNDYASANNLKQIHVGKIIIPKNRTKNVISFTHIEQKKILRSLNTKKHPNQIGVLLCMCTGLRLGELLALTWEDVDFAKNIININKSLYYKNKLFIQTSPKTPSSIRVIPLPKFLKQDLLNHKKLSNSIYIISKDGKQVIPRTYQYEFEVLLKNANVKKKGFHSLRHTFATNAVECGMDIKCLADILGHANPMITLKRYTHSMLDYKMSIMNKMSKMYFD